MMRSLVLCIALGLGFGAVSVCAAPELPITVEALGLRFMTPDGWRLLAESSNEQLVLAPGKSKNTPILRVQAFRGRLSAKDRLKQMARGLPGEEGLISYTSAEDWTLDGRTFETVTGLYKKGSQEWYAQFTLVDQPKKLQHAFWLFGRKQDLVRQQDVVRASIRSSATGEVAQAGGTGGEAPPVVGATIWQDVKSGLHIARWPAGYAPDEASLTRLSSTGLVLKPKGSGAPASTEVRISRRSVSEMVSAESTLNTLEERLASASGVSKIKRLKLRVAGISGESMRWSQEIQGTEYSFEVWLWKRGSALFRLDSSGPSSWLGTRKRRDLVKDFAGGLSFP